MSHLSNKEGKEGRLSSTFYLKSCYRNHRHQKSSEALCHHQRFGNKHPTGLVYISRESYLIRCHLLQLWEIITFISPDYLRFLQNLELYLGLSPESRNLFLGLSWHKPCLAIPDEASLMRLKKVLLEVSFLIDKIFRLESLPLLRAQYKKIALPKHGYF